MTSDRQEPLGKDFAEKIFDAYDRMEQATVELSRLEDILEEVCQEIKSSFGFDFVSISLIYPERNSIEASYGIGIAKNWSGRAGHYIEEDPDLRDIQADIVQNCQNPCRTEIISGWDDRFDRGIYEEQKHDKLVRVYTPIVLVRDKNSKPKEDWVHDFEQVQVFDQGKEKTDGQHITVDLQLNNVPREDIEVIGTVEAGYDNRQKEIKYEQAIDLVKLVAKSAIKIRKAQLPYILETIADCARQILGAKSASLYFPRDLEKANSSYQKYIYPACAGEFTSSLLRTIPPRKGGLGEQAIRDKKTKFIPDSSQNHAPDALKRLNQPVWKIGVKAMAAFPLLVEKQTGILYVAFNREHQFTEEELRWGELFAKRAVDAIRYAITYERMQYKNHQLKTLHSVVQSLVHQQEEKTLLRRIACNTLNILAADVVTIYEYIQTESKFLIPPEMAGRLKEKEDMHHEIDSKNVPYKLVEHGVNVYPQDPQYEQIFANSPFVEREKIELAAGILLKVEEETVGIMFINYRRFHEFSDDEKQIIETLASSAAIAIKNQRWMTTLSDIESEIITTLDREKLLSLIVQKAVEITGADVGDILRLDSTKEELVIETKYPSNFNLVNPDNSRLKLGEGITGWVAKHKKAVIVDDVNKPVIVDDVNTDARYRPYYENIHSELCVPLLDQDNVLGVLNVESETEKAFTQRDLTRLKVLANQAVIAIQYVENKKQLVTAEKLAKQLPTSTSASEVQDRLKEEGVSDLFSHGALQQTELMFEVLEQLKSSQSEQFKFMLDSLRLNNYFSLKDIPRNHHKSTYDLFCETYNYLDIAPFHPDSSKFEVHNKADMDVFKESWQEIYNNLARKNIELFQKHTDKLTSLFSSKLEFNILRGKKETVGRFYGEMIEPYPRAFNLKILHEFSVIYVCQEKFSGRNINQIIGLLNKLQNPADSFALIIAFEKNCESLYTEIRQSAFRNDFIVLNYDQFWDVMAAKYPVERLRYHILKQIDLVKVSPYTTAGPIEGEIFFGRAAEEKALIENISHNSYALLANRKMGKTSLLNKVVSILEKDTGKLVFYCDLQAAHSYETFYEQFYQELFRICPDLKDKITKTNEYSPFDFLKIIQQTQQYKNKNIIVVLDEVDELLKNDANEQLFRTFRSLSQRNNVRFIFSGTTKIVEQLLDPNSPLFNFCERIKLELLEPKASQDLIIIPMKSIDVQFKNEKVIVNNIISITARHPNMIQYICDKLIKEINKQQKRIITEKELQKVIDSREFYEYFESLIWGQSTDLEKFIVYLMWNYPEFTEAQVMEEFTKRGLSTERIRDSLKTLQIYSTLSKKGNKYFFTFNKFKEVMEKESDIEELTKIYQRKIGGYRT